MSTFPTALASELRNLVRTSSLVRLACGWVAYRAIRRFSRRSGVTEKEFLARLPGDDVILDPMVEWTRATTINAPPKAVWQWMVQMSLGRGSWYTSERFDRLVWRIENPRLQPVTSRPYHWRASRTRRRAGVLDRCGDTGSKDSGHYLLWWNQLCAGGAGTWLRSPRLTNSGTWVVGWVDDHWEACLHRQSLLEPLHLVENPPAEIQWIGLKQGLSMVTPGTRDSDLDAFTTEKGLDVQPFIRPEHDVLGTLHTGTRRTLPRINPHRFHILNCIPRLSHPHCL